jgi:hypothetical protein
MINLSQLYVVLLRWHTCMIQLVKYDVSNNTTAFKNKAVC